MTHRFTSLAQFAATALLVLSPQVGAHSPHDVVSDFTLSPTFAVDHTVFSVMTQSENQLLSRSTDGGLSWKALGIAPLINGYQGMTLSDDFATDGTCFIATSQAGVWRSVDFGDTWARSNVGLTDIKVRDIAVSPSFSTDQTVAAVTDSGIFRSTDGGSSWALSNSGITGTTPTILHTARGTTGTLFAARQDLYRSIDAGATWEVLETFGQPVTEIATSPSFVLDHDLAVSFGRYGVGVMWSDDGGLTYTEMNTGLNELFVNGLEIAEDGTVFACTQLDAAYRADALGGDWTLFTEGFEALSDLTADHYVDVATTPTFTTDGTVFVAGYEGMFLSTDRGETFEQRNTYPVTVVRAIDMSTNFVGDGFAFAASYGGGVYRLDKAAGERKLVPSHTPRGLEGTTSQGSGAPALIGGSGGTGGISPPGVRRWTSTSLGINSTFSATLQTAPNYSAADPTLFYTYDGVYRSTNNGASWEIVPTPDSPIVRFVGIAPDYPADNTLFVSTGLGFKTWRSTDDGQNWDLLDVGLPPSYTGRYLRLSPAFASDQTVFLSTKSRGIFRSTDRGDTWEDVTGEIPAQTVVRHFVMSPSFDVDGVLFAATRNEGIWRSLDGGNTWNNPMIGLPPSQDLSIESLAVSPNFLEDETVFIATQSHEVFKSIDRGRTWTNMSVGLPQTACWAIDISPTFAVDRTVMVATNDWLWESTNAGESWSRLPTYARIDDLYNEVTYDGFWLNPELTGCFSIGARTSDTPGNTTSYSFYGSEVSWYGVLNPNGGMANISIDGELVAVVDTYSPIQRTHVLLFSEAFDTLDLRRITIEVAGSSNPKSSGFRIQSDGFAYRFEDE